MIDLQSIKNPDFLKNLSLKELENLAELIRQFIIDSVSKTGGHLSSSLGTVELIIALYYVFNAPFDKLIFDVGHQAYTHKILTGRANDFSTLRKDDGLSGFLSMRESIYDVYEAGHSSTSISAASGFIKAREKGEKIGEVVSIIGDASIQNGLALEAINYLGDHEKQKSIIILNDNNMSISKNVGRISRFFNKIRIKKSYNRFSKIIPMRIRHSLKTIVYGENPFSSMGYRYFGPIDGHNIKLLIKYFEFAKNCNEPVFLHIKTIKGKGYSFAEEDKIGKWHGVGPFNKETGEFISNKKDELVKWSEGISNLLLEEAKLNNKIHVITPAMIYGSDLIDFQKELPSQITDCGIAEDHAVIMANALSLAGQIPIVMLYSTFLQRAYDAINHDVCRINQHVVFLIDRSGIIGEDGSTHQGVFDLGLLNALPNIEILMPKDLTDAKILLNYAINIAKGPVAIRYPRGYTNSEIRLNNKSIEKFEIVLPLKEKNIITYGEDVLEFKKYLVELNKNYGLINAQFIKPLDLNFLSKLKNTNLIVYENNMIQGGLASSLLIINSKCDFNINFEIIGIDDQYVKHGNIQNVKNKLGLNIEEIVKRLK
ncbi:MAG: 1-deoxy-D-xylulose-5-phosphate synthase [Bacilli bacterium]|nr:1-deoxy-D-xylulose-5-phosphate synthase [Bacilli bacterium]